MADLNTVAVADDAIDRSLTESAKLRQENERLKDALTVARRRIRVLRGSDVLTSASSRGVVIWLRAILGDANAGDYSALRRHMNALIQTLAGDDDAG